MLEPGIKILAVADAPRRMFRERLGQSINLVEQPTVAQMGVEIDNGHDTCILSIRVSNLRRNRTAAELVHFDPRRQYEPREFQWTVTGMGPAAVSPYEQIFGVCDHQEIQRPA